MRIIASQPQEFLDYPFPSNAVWADAKYTSRCNKIIPKIGARFGFRIKVGATQVYPTMYLLKPANTIVFHKTPTWNVVTHELGHHVWHKLVAAKDKARITRLCSTEDDVDPNEQFATTVELLVCGYGERFKRTDQQVSLSLAENTHLQATVSKFFSIN